MLLDHRGRRAKHHSIVDARNPTETQSTQPLHGTRPGYQRVTKARTRLLSAIGGDRLVLRHKVQGLLLKDTVGMDVHARKKVDYQRLMDS